MAKKRLRNFVYTAFRKNELGFTFITLLFAITIMFLTIPFITYMTKKLDYSNDYDELSVQQFFYFLRDEVINATDLTTTPTSIILSKYDGTVVNIEKYINSIRRQADSGHEIFLMDVKDISIIPKSFGFQIIIKNLQGETYEKTIVYYY